MKIVSKKSSSFGKYIVFRNRAGIIESIKKEDGGYEKV